MKSLTKVKLSLGFIFIVYFAGVLLSGDIYIIPKEASVCVHMGDNNISLFDSFLVQNKRILADAETFLDYFGKDLSYQLSDDADSLIINYCGDTLEFSADSNKVKYNSDETEIPAAPVISDSELFIPMRETAEFLDCRVLWDSQISRAAIEFGQKKNTMEDTAVTDEYRYYKYNETFNGFDIFGNGEEYICTEKVDISTENCDRYADIINSFANAVPNSQTYAVLVPTSYEFYAAADRKSDYTEKFKYIYSKFGKGVRGVNVVKTLAEHADEDIYFNTDHHWTQLGAYYAYREFLRFGFDEIKEPESFKKESIGYFQGSFLEYTEGTKGYDYVADSFDRLDMYYPSVEYTGESYYDVNFKEYIAPMTAVNPSFRNYDSFMDGDYPIEVYKTNVPNDKKICIVKDSFGNAFAVWALNNYKEVYVVDYRRFNNYLGDSESYRDFKISDFYNNVHFDDLVILSYPVTISSEAEISALEAMAK